MFCIRPVLDLFFYFFNLFGMSYSKKWFTLLEIIIVLALIWLFIVATSYYNRDTRIYQANAERLANNVKDTIQSARNNMILGRWVLSGSSLVVANQRVISIWWSGITSVYGTTNTGSESSLIWPFFDNDTQYRITDISVSSGILLNGIMPIWDQTWVTASEITILTNGNLQISALGVATPINILRITAGYAGFERSVMVDRIMGRTEVVLWRGEETYIPAPPSPPPNSCATNPSFPNIGTLTIWAPSSVGQAWIYSAAPGDCTYDCTGGYAGASCATPPTNSCATSPSFPNIGTITTGSPSSVWQAWIYSAMAGNCTYDCTGGYTGNNCLTVPANSCDTSPSFPNIGTLTTGSPSSVWQAWTYNVTPGNCTYVCTGGYTWPSCATPPAVTGFTTVWHVGYAWYGNADNTVRFTVTTTASPMIDWGDGTIEVLTATPSHTYASSGDYTVKMSGISTFFLYGANSNYHGKLLSVTDWGGIAWTNMWSMFRFADHLNLLPVAAPNMGGVTNMSSMFAAAYAFNQSISNFNTANVTNMWSMFNGAIAFNQPVSNFNTANVTDMSYMFNGAQVFNQSLASFNTSNVNNMEYMFGGANVFNQPLTSFNTSTVMNMSSMFAYAGAFNQSLASFNTANVTNMYNMFSHATAFNQPLASFSTSNVTNMAGMFQYTTVFNQNISNWCVSLIATKPSMFDLIANAWFANNAPVQPQWGTCPVVYTRQVYAACKTTPTLYLASAIGSMSIAEGDTRCRVSAGSNYFWAKYEDIDCWAWSDATYLNNNQLIWNWATTHGVPSCSAQWDAAQTVYQLYSAPYTGYFLSDHYLVTKLWAIDGNNSCSASAASMVGADANYPMQSVCTSARPTTAPLICCRTSAVEIAPCAAGTHSATGNDPCTLATAGNYDPGVGATAQTPASAGYYVVGTGATAQTPASAGYYVPSTGQSTQTMCPANTYQWSTGQSSCTACPGGNVSPAGSTNVSQCVPGACPGGYSYVDLPVGFWKCYSPMRWPIGYQAAWDNCAVDAGTIVSGSPWGWQLCTYTGNCAAITGTEKTIWSSGGDRNTFGLTNQSNLARSGWAWFWNISTYASNSWITSVASPPDAADGTHYYWCQK